MLILRKLGVIALSGIAIVNGGYWEAHRHLITGASMALLGILTLVLMGLGNHLQRLD